MNGRLPLEDSFDFDDLSTELILMTRSIFWDTLRFSQIVFVSDCRRTAVGWSSDGCFRTKILIFKILDFNWPGLGHRRAAPSVRAVPPQPWPIEIICVRAIDRWNDPLMYDRRIVFLIFLPQTVPGCNRGYAYTCNCRHRCL